MVTERSKDRPELDYQAPLKFGSVFFTENSHKGADGRRIFSCYVTIYPGDTPDSPIDASEIIFQNRNFILGEPQTIEPKRIIAVSKCKWSSDQIQALINPKYSAIIRSFYEHRCGVRLIKLRIDKSDYLDTEKSFQNH